MRVAVIDIGSNTARLLVAEQGARNAERIAEAKAYLRLGAEILRTGSVGPDKLAETADEARRFVSIARQLDASAVDVFVTAPARQAANADELIRTIARATGRFVRVLSAEEEGRLAYEGALATTAVGADPVAVCDVGGGSTEITVGDRVRGPFWSRSVEIGSLRLTAATLHDDPPSAEQLADARELTAELFDGIQPPAVATALAVGGSARALARISGRQLDEDALERTLAAIAEAPAEQLTQKWAIETSRADTLAGGAIILLELTRRLGRPLQLAGGGLREGAAARLLAPREAA
jgi:exopolyphosphatase/guanosine-5'-triphosphate,3'-diphosphate pyrophosphatase